MKKKFNAKVSNEIKTAELISTDPSVVDAFECVVVNGANEYDALKLPVSILCDQLDTDHLTVAHYLIRKSLPTWHKSSQ